MEAVAAKASLLIGAPNFATKQCSEKSQSVSRSFAFKSQAFSLRVSGQNLSSSNSYRNSHGYPRARPACSAAKRTVIATAAVKSLKWMLLPIGDGDIKHLEEDAVDIPGILVLDKDVSVIGRLPEKADIVLPIATISGAHARLQKEDDELYVTDLGSTNGTFLDYKKLQPNAPIRVESGSVLIFGDEHLAKYRFAMVDESGDS